MKNTHRHPSVLRGTLLLTGSALAAKLLGALFRIPLTSLLGGAGMGYFGSAYGLFMPLYALLVTGLSAAVARPAAAFLGQSEPAAARRLLTVARRFALLAGLAGTLASAALSGVFLRLTGSSPEALPAVLALSPAVLLCSLSAVERGYREGACRMAPTALSQLAEALVRLIAGLALAGLWMREPPAFLAGYSPAAAGACGAVAGVTLASLAGWLTVLRREPPATGDVPEDRELLRKLLHMLIPAALAALVTELTALTDLLTMQHCFERMLRDNAAAFYVQVGLSRTIPQEDAPAFVYGSYMGLAAAVAGLVPGLAAMPAKAALPCAAQAWESGDRTAAAGYARQVLGMTLMAAVPAGCLLYSLPEGALQFLFAGRMAEIRIASTALRYLAPGMVCLCLTVPAFSLLQAAGRADLPVKLMLPAAAVKLVGNLALLPCMGTAGAALSTSLSQAVLLLCVLVAMRKVFGRGLLPLRTAVRLLYAGSLCAAMAWLCYTRLHCLLPQRVAFLAALVAGMGSYVGTIAAAAEVFSFKPARNF